MRESSELVRCRHDEIFIRSKSHGFFAGGSQPSKRDRPTRRAFPFSINGRDRHVSAGNHDRLARKTNDPFNEKLRRVVGITEDANFAPLGFAQAVGDLVNDQILLILKIRSIDAPLT